MYDYSPIDYTSVLISKKLKVAIFGTSTGSVRVYLWPFCYTQKENVQYIDVTIHQGPCVQLRVTYDNLYLISASLDGSIFFSKIKEVENGEDL